MRSEDLILLLAAPVALVEPYAIVIIVAGALLLQFVAGVLLQVALMSDRAFGVFVLLAGPRSQTTNRHRPASYAAPGHSPVEAF